MELTRRQKILLISLCGVALLLVFGLILWMSLDSSGDPVPEEPTMPATAVPTPTPTTTPEITPKASPTPYRLPLVPNETGVPKTSSSPSPTVETSPSPSPEANAGTVQIKPDARVGTYNAKQKEFVAIGTQNGEAIAILLVRVQQHEAEIISIPAETYAPVYTLGANAAVLALELAPIGTACARAETQREGCWNLIWAIKNLTGFQPPHYLCVDFACMDDFFTFVPSLESDDGAIDRDGFLTILNDSGASRAQRFAQFGIGTVRYLSEVSLWELPAFRNATRGSFTASLSFWELLSLMRSLKSVTSFSVSVLSDADAFPFS